MKGQALRPDFFTPNIVKDKEAEKKGATEEERQLYQLSLTHGWKVLKEHFDNEVGRLDTLQGEAIASGMSMEQVGYNAIVIDLVKKIVKALIDKVQDAKESCENPDGTDK